PAGEAALKPGGHFAAGSWCKWCKHKRNCNVFSTWKNGEAETGFGPLEILKPEKPAVIEFPPLSELTDAQIGKYLYAIELLQPVKKLLIEEAVSRAQLSEEPVVIPNHAFTKTSPHRKWKKGAEETLEMVLGEDTIYDRKLKSPAKLETRIGKKNKHIVADLSEKPEGKLTLAPAKTTRYIVDPKATAAEGFSVVVAKEG
ncbi:hypothetical protein MHBO_004755, partial [Bonamia ostreae]